MIRRRRMVLSAAMAAIGIAAMAWGLGSQGTHPALAGDPTPTATFDPCLDRIAPARAADDGVRFVGFHAQQPVCTSPTATDTVRPRTKTPTPPPSATATKPASATVEPTKAPATATKAPSGGAGAGGVRPPNTGTGGDSGSGAWTWVIAGGAALAALGFAGVAAGALRRR